MLTCNNYSKYFRYILTLKSSDFQQLKQYNHNYYAYYLLNIPSYLSYLTFKNTQTFVTYFWTYPLLILSKIPLYVIYSPFPVTFSTTNKLDFIQNWTRYYKNVKFKNYIFVNCYMLSNFFYLILLIFKFV